MAEYFKSVFFDLAPVLALPLYRQQKPREFIYRDVYPANYTGREAEVLANRLGYAPFAHIDSKTDCILKARPLQKNGLSDRVAVTAYSFDTAERVDLVPMYGGDGRMHEVPVYWTEYLPVYNTAEMALKEVGGTREAFEGKRRAGRPLFAAAHLCPRRQFRLRRRPHRLPLRGGAVRRRSRRQAWQHVRHRAGGFHGRVYRGGWKRSKRRQTSSTEKRRRRLLNRKGKNKSARPKALPDPKKHKGLPNRKGKNKQPRPKVLPNQKKKRPAMRRGRKKRADLPQASRLRNSIHKTTRIKRRTKPWQTN